MTFETDLGYSFMHLYLTLHPKKSSAYDPTEEGYISNEEESRLHHFAEFIRYNARIGESFERLRVEDGATADEKINQLSARGWQDFMKNFKANVKGDIEFDDAALKETFAKFAKDVQRICSRPHSQLEIELAKSLNKTC